MLAWLARLAHQGYAAHLRRRAHAQATTRAPFVFGWHRRNAEHYRRHVDPAGPPSPLAEHEHRALELIEAGERAANGREGS